MKKVMPTRQSLYTFGFSQICQEIDLVSVEQMIEVPNITTCLFETNYSNFERIIG